MNRKYNSKSNLFKIKENIVRYIEENMKEYIIIGLIFVIGIIIGVIYINNTTELQRIEIIEYITSFISKLKDGETIKEIELLLQSLKKNMVFAFVIWFMGTTIIGIPVVFALICYKGFCFGYTISASIISFGIREGTYIFPIKYIFSKYYIYTKHNITCNKWYKNS